MSLHYPITHSEFCILAGPVSPAERPLLLYSCHIHLFRHSSRVSSFMHLSLTVLFISLSYEFLRHLFCLPCIVYSVQAASYSLCMVISYMAIYSLCMVPAGQWDRRIWKPLKAVLHSSLQSTRCILGPQQIFVDENGNFVSTWRWYSKAFLQLLESAWS